MYSYASYGNPSVTSLLNLSTDAQYQNGIFQTQKRTSLYEAILILDQIKLSKTYTSEYLFASGSVDYVNFDTNVPHKSEMTLVSSKEKSPTVMEGFFGLSTAFNLFNAEGEVGFGNKNYSISQKANVEYLTANAEAGVTYKGGLGASVGAKASVLSGEIVRSLNILGFEFEIGLSADFLSAGVSASAGMTKTLDGKTKLNVETEAGLVLFGWGITFSMVIPY